MAAGPTVQAATPAMVSPTLYERMLALVNAARAETGAGPLALEPRLMAAACTQGRDLADGGPLSHRGRDGSDLADRLTRAGYAFAMAAENLAAGAPTPDETVWLWRGSPDHRRAMLTSEFRQAGIAYVHGDGRAIWVLVLATPRSAEPANQAPGAPPSAATRIVQC